MRPAALAQRSGQAATLSNYPPLRSPRLSISRVLLISPLTDTPGVHRPAQAWVRRSVCRHWRAQAGQTLQAHWKRGRKRPPAGYWRRHGRERDIGRSAGMGAADGSRLARRERARDRKPSGAGPGMRVADAPIGN